MRRLHKTVGQPFSQVALMADDRHAKLEALVSSQFGRYFPIRMAVFNLRKDARTLS